jgi:hypothetical protein
MLFSTLQPGLVQSGAFISLRDPCCFGVSHRMRVYKVFFIHRMCQGCSWKGGKSCYAETTFYSGPTHMASGAVAHLVLVRSLARATPPNLALPSHNYAPMMTLVRVPDLHLTSQVDAIF